MKIKWLGHSSFLITGSSGVRILTDPYDPNAYNGALRYGEFNEPVDVVLMSHEHADHGYAGAATGSAIIIKGDGDYLASGVEFNGVPTFHDTSGGSERGRNTVYAFAVDGITVCHLGDLGHVLNNDQAAEIGAVDVLLVPVGGYFTIGPDEAWKIADQLAAKIVIPMHFKTEKIDFPIAPVDDFLKDKPDVRRLNKSEIELSAKDLPSQREIIVLKPAL